MIEIWKMCLILGAVLLLALVGMWAYRQYLIRKVDGVMEQVDDTIEQLIHHREVKYFSENQDDLLGKFQHEILQLHDMLRSCEAREKELRIQLGSSISDLVHQLNTPIANISLYSGFLQEEDLDEAQRKHFAENIARQAQKLGWLGEGFAKLSRMETGIIALHSESQPILPALLRAIDQITPKAKQHGNDIHLSGDHKLAAFFDAKWTEEVFYNLLDNAVKYSNKDSIITVELIPYEMYVRINVIDQGIPIPREERAKVFQRFYRSPQTADSEGVGLGLYLSREIIRGQQGYMKIEENVEKETVISIFLRR